MSFVGYLDTREKLGYKAKADHRAVFKIERFRMFIISILRL